jgi:sulfite reductase (NADPH) hemoprotein beta-component
VTTPSSILVKSIPHLYKLAQYPVVLHVSLQPSGFPDFSGFTFLQSETLQEAQDLALTAHALAVKSGKGVIHFFDSGATAFKSHAIDYEDSELVRRVMDLDEVASFQRTTSDETTLYADDGRSVNLAFPRSQAETSGSAPAPPSSSEQQTPLPASEKASERADSSSASSERHTSTSGASVSSATTADSIVSKPISSDDIYRFATQIWATLRDATGRSYDAFAYSGTGQEEAAIFLFGADTAVFATEIDSVEESEQYAKAGIITARLYRPWLGASLAHLLPR